MLKVTGCQWLTPVILPIQEAEIRRMHNSSQDPLSKPLPPKKGWWRAQTEGPEFKPQTTHKDNVERLALARMDCRKCQSSSCETDDRWESNNGR
jgi:hypothetical protein